MPEPTPAEHPTGPEPSAEPTPLAERGPTEGPTPPAGTAAGKPPRKPTGKQPAQAPAETGGAPREPDAPDDEAATRPRRRQARGERRIAQLLDAAATVFTTSGYTAASTNAIAREAGVSPGTLYQFFPNKEAIAIELGGRLMERWRLSHGEALLASHLELPLDELLDSVLDPLFAFNYENPAFAVLIHGPDTPGQIAEEFTYVHEGLLARIDEILGEHLPDTPPAELARVSRTTLTLFKAGLDLALAHEGEERQEYVREIKKVIFRYLEPLFPGAATGDCPIAAARSGAPREEA